MDLKCSMPSCLKGPDFYCNCLGNKVLYCFQHISTHLASDFSVSHSVASAYKTVKEFDKTKLLNLMGKTINHYKYFLNLLNIEIQALLTESTKVIKSFKNFIKYLQENIKEITTKGRVLIPIESENNSTIKAFTFDHLSYFHCTFKNQVNIEGFLSKLKDISLMLYHEHNKNQFEISFENEALYFTSQKSDSLIRFDPETESLSKIAIENFSFKRSLPAVCATSANEVFMYGGFLSNQRFNSAFLADLKSGSVSELPQNIVRAQASALIALDRVYVFGGTNLHGSDNTAKSNYFDLELKAWVSISDIPKKTRNTSTELVNNKIIVTGTGSDIWMFDIKNGGYENITESVVVGTSNIVFKYGEICYLLTDKMLFFAELSDLSTWHSKYISTTFSCTSFKTVGSMKNQSVYFADSDERVFKFDPINLILKQLEV